MNAAEGQDNSQDLLLLDHNGAICTLTLNRPRQFNALSEALISEMTATLAKLADDPQVKVVVIAGAGRAFCAGHDLKEMQSDRDADRIARLFKACSRVMQLITALPQPVIAKVHGMATAAGCQLVAQCDLAVASEVASFAVSGVNLGLFCATPAVPLSRAVGRKRAAQMLFTGDFVDAHTALEWGLVNQVVTPEALDGAVAELAAKLTAKPREVLATGKHLFYRQLEMGMAAAYQDASQTITCNFMEASANEGIKAFLEKRRPNWE
jgi:enoyl-CoA hydratase/carnithine racemase